MGPAHRPSCAPEIGDAASAPNGVLRLKHGNLPAILFSAILDEFRQLDGHDGTRPGILESAFPSSRHIFMTRRNKVRLAVSWWKAIQSQEWHGFHGTPPQDVDIADCYHSRRAHGTSILTPSPGS